MASAVAQVETLRSLTRALHDPHAAGVACHTCWSSVRASEAHVVVVFGVIHDRSTYVCVWSLIGDRGSQGEWACAVWSAFQLFSVSTADSKLCESRSTPPDLHLSSGGSLEDSLVCLRVESRFARSLVAACCAVTTLPHAPIVLANAAVSPECMFYFLTVGRCWAALPPEFTNQP